MSENLAKVLDLDIAWKRVKADMSHRVFIRHPYEIKLVELDLGGWLDSLLNAIQKDLYNPSPIVICDVPKGKGAVRPGGHLTLADRVIFAACVGACFSQIYQTLFWSQGKVDYSYRLSKEPNDPIWLSNQFEGWKDFRIKSLEKIKQGVSYVVIADISAYYENIDISYLISDLKQIDANSEAIKQLSVCLNRWAQVPGRGIPQGHTPSDILGKLYLNSVDQIMQTMGYSHYRYVDDIRIFCRNLVEAKKALVDLTRVLRKRGLNLQSAKSEIYRADKAKTIIEGVVPIINSVREKFIAEVVSEFSLGDPYISMAVAEEVLSSQPVEPDSAPLELIREVYKTYFIDSTDGSFDKTLFRFLLNRLGKNKDKFALLHCASLFEKHPEETHTILSYYKATESVSEVTNAIVEFLESEDAVYQYQVYQIIEWFCEVSCQPPVGLIAIIRDLAFDNGKPPYLRAICRNFLGVFGSVADLERLEHSYPEASNPLEQWGFTPILRTHLKRAIIAREVCHAESKEV